MLFDFLAGCLGGVAGVLVGHPLDTIKVNIQVKSSVDPHYQGTLATLHTLKKLDGIKGLYRGVTSPLIGLSGVNAISFGVFHNVEGLIPGPTSYHAVLLAGGVAGFAGSFLLSPIELTKTRMQVAGYRAGKNPLQTIFKLYKQEGIKAIFHGIGMTMTREVPASMAYFMVYDCFTQPIENCSTMTMVLAGGFAGTISWAIPYPADVIKSKIQVDGMFSEKLYTSSYDCFRKVMKAEGLQGFYHGFAPTIIRAFPVNALTFTVVIWSRILYDNSSNRSSEVSQTEPKHRGPFKDPERIRSSHDIFDDNNTICLMVIPPESV